MGSFLDVRSSRSSGVAPLGSLQGPLGSQGAGRRRGTGRGCHFISFSGSYGRILLQVLPSRSPCPSRPEEEDRSELNKGQRSLNPFSEFYLRGFRYRKEREIEPSPSPVRLNDGVTDVWDRPFPSFPSHQWDLPPGHDWTPRVRGGLPGCPYTVLHQVTMVTGQKGSFRGLSLHLHFKGLKKLQ